MYKNAYRKSQKLSPMQKNVWKIYKIYQVQQNFEANANSISTYKSVTLTFGT